MVSSWPPRMSDGIAADAQARAGDQALIDRVAYSRIGGACALSSHVALGGKAGHQVGAGRERGDDGALRNGFLTVCRSSAPGCRKRCTCASIRPGIKVGRQDRSPARRLDASPSGRPRRCVRLGPIPRRAWYVASLDVEQASGVKNDSGGWRRRTRLGTERRGDDQEREKAGHLYGILSVRDASSTCSTSDW